MNETMIANYNSVIGPKDKVLWLGDSFFAKLNQCRGVLNRLNGKKHLVLGNHDYDPHLMNSMGFELVTDRLYGMMAGRKIVAIHYDQWKYRSIWDDRYENLRYQPKNEEVIIHGHTHQKSKVLLNQVHAGVDAWNFTPALRHEVEDLIRKIPFNLASSKQQESLLFEFRDMLRKNPDNEALNDPKYDFLRSLGWQKETKMREK